MWGPAIEMVRVVRLSVNLSHANISETKRDGHMVTRKFEWETGLPDSESAIRFAIGLFRHFGCFWVGTSPFSDKNGPVGLVNVVNGSVDWIWNNLPV